MNNPIISIITPTLNSEKDIEACLLSVANQSYENMEHLIIDGISSDKTLEIVEKYAQKYPHIKLISEKDEGIYHAMNKGIDLASGEWIYFLGSDDVFFDNDVLLDISKNLENVDVLYGNVKFKISGKIYDGEFNKSKLIEKNICHQSIFQRKKIYKLFGKYETKYKGVADWVFNMKWFNSKEINYKFIDRIVAVYNEDGYCFNNPDIEFEKDKEEIIKREFSDNIITPLNTKEISMDKQKIRAIAFYLPQFHAISENNTWWGEGFTEWTNVKKAKPLFDGHYQPHIPHDDIGYYNLENVDVLKKQAEMVKKYGIHGFCFYHYWFGGKKLLEKPLRNLLNHPEIDLPFCVCWANENWTRRWDGKDKEILMSQNHSNEDDLNFIKDLMPVLKDERYIKVDGKPLVLIYRPALLPDSKETMRVWKEEAKKNGIADLYIVRIENFDRNISPENFGCDASVKFAPNFDILGPDKIADNPFRGSYDSSLIDDFISKDENYSLFKCVCPGWDNAARRQDGGGATFIDASPKKYKYWLRKVIEYTYYKFRGDKRLVFINAWNEWGEGAHLEPDKKFGYGYLEATRDALEKINPDSVDYNDFEIERDVVVNNISTKLLNFNQKIQQKDREIISKEQAIQQKDQEINFIKSSKFWKLREQYIYLKNGIEFLVFSPRKFIKKYFKI